MDKLTGKFIWKFKESQIAKTTGKEKVEGLTLPNFTNYKVIVIETVCTGIKRHTYIDRIDLESKNKPIHYYSQLVLDKSARTMQWRKNGLSNKPW